MLNSGLSPSTVKTAIDEVVKSRFEREAEPGEVLATDGLFFRQQSTSKQAEIVEEYLPPTEFGVHAEAEEVEEATIATGNQKTFTVINYKKSLPIPIEYFEDEMHGVVQHTFSEMGRKARNTRDHAAFNASYGNAFSVTTPDGAALVSATHTTMSGDTVDNLETGVLNATNLETLVKNLALQKDQSGEFGGHVIKGLLVPRILHPDAVEIAESELQTGTANNNLNYFSKIYPGMVVGSSGFLDSTYNSLNSNADTSYFGVSQDHLVTRWDRLGFTTSIVGHEYDSQDRMMYKARFRQVVGPRGFEGLAGSNGTA